MNALMLLTIVAVTTFEYLGKTGLMPMIFRFAPEILSAVIVLCVVALGSRTRFRFVRSQYWLVFAGMAVVMICGVIANAVAPGPLFAGLRSYLRAAPLFFVPAVYAFSEREIRTQLLLLLAICLPQLPIALSQRTAHLATGGATGDTTTGTLMGSGLLSIFLVCAACVLTGMYVRKRIRGLPFLLLFVLVILPTTLNETKATVVLLPLGLLAVFVLASEPGVRLRNGLTALLLIATFAGIFVPIYDYYISKNRYGTPIMTFYSDEQRFDRYVSHEHAAVGARSLRQVGRLDAIVIPLKETVRDPTRLAFGVGLGNASQSSLGAQFTGRYYDRYGAFLQTAASIFTLELGLGGLALVMGCYWMIYRDSRVVSEEPGLIGALAAGWTGVTVVMVIATFYATIPASAALSYLFWYFSGLIAAHRVRLALGQPVAGPAEARTSGTT